MNEWTVRVSIACVFTLLGWIIGHRLALGREKRKEYNEAIAPIRSVLIKGKHVNESLIIELEVKMGSSCKATINTFHNYYKPELDKLYEVFEVNEIGYLVPPPHLEKECDEKLKMIKNRLLETCKLK